MEVMNSQNLREYLKNHQNIDYIAHLITPWHAHGVDAAVQWLESKEGRKLNGLVLAARSGRVGYMVDESYFAREHQCIAGYEYTVKKQSLLTNCFHELNGVRASKNKKNLPPIYVLTPMGPDFHLIYLLSVVMPDRKVVAVITDEGTAYYFHDEKRWIKEFSSNKIKQLYYCVNRDIHKFYVHLLEKNHACLRATLFKMDSAGIMEENKEISPFFRDTVKKCASNRNVKMPDFEKRYVLVNTTYDENVKSEKGLELLGKIAEACSENGIQMVIKPHPGEKDISMYQKLPVTLFEQKNIAQEDLLMLMPKPSLLIGFNSTTEISCSVINQVKTCDILQMLCKDDESLKDLYNEALKFSNATKKLVVSVSDMEEFNNLLKNL